MAELILVEKGISPEQMTTTITKSLTLNKRKKKKSLLINALKMDQMTHAWTNKTLKRLQRPKQCQQTTEVGKLYN